MLHDQSKTDPFMLDCMICAEHAATLVDPSGLFYCAKCSPIEANTILPEDEYCISCGVDSRAAGKEVCTWCFESTYADYAGSRVTNTSQYYGGYGGYSWWDDEEEELLLQNTPVEDDVELIKAARR